MKEKRIIRVVDLVLIVVWLAALGFTLYSLIVMGF